MYHKTVSISTSTVLPAAFFAAISAVALVVSFMAASYLYARSTLIPYGVLLALSFILLELMIVVYFSLLSEFSSSIFGKKKDIPVLDQADIVQAVPMRNKRKSCRLQTQQVRNVLSQPVMSLHPPMSQFRILPSQKKRTGKLLSS